MSCCVGYQHIGGDCNLQLFSMEIDLKREESTETCQFINFSIREYVDEIRKKNPAKCWPFGSLSNCHEKIVTSYQSSDSTQAPNNMIESLGSKVGNGSTELTSCKVNNGQIRHENNADEGDKIRHNLAADNNEPGRNRPRRKHHKFRLLSDVYKDPASELRAGCNRTHPENVNRRFITEIEDDSDDDATLAAYFKKQKGVEVTDSARKKRNVVGVEDPSVDPDRKSNHEAEGSYGKDSNVGPPRKKTRTDDVDTQTMALHNKDLRLQCSQKSNQLAEVNRKEAATVKEKEDFEMEAVMLLARHFNEEKQILRKCRRLGSGPLMVGPIGLGPITSLLGLGPTTSCACVKKKIQQRPTQTGNESNTKTSSKTATNHPVKKITKQKLENTSCSVQRRSFMPAKATTNGGFQNHFEMSVTKGVGVGPGAQNCAALVCSFNRNPADFSAPNGDNRFMRGG